MEVKPIEIKNIASNYNLSVMAVFSEPLKLADIMRKMSESGQEMIEPLPTQSLTNPRMIMLGLSMPGIKLTRILDTDLNAYNLQYPSQLRGIFTFRVQNVPLNVKIDPHFEGLVDTIKKLGYEDKLFFYEIVINLEAEFVSFVNMKNLFPDLLTIANPKLYSLRLFDGNITDKDPREELWSELQVEPIINNPKRVVVNAIYRKNKYDNRLIDNIFQDIQKIFGRLRETNV